MKGVEKLDYGAILSKLLPGDRIHDVAQQEASSDAKIEALEAAQLKRMRKLEKARKR
jgi:hypothetical protein